MLYDTFENSINKRKISIRLNLKCNFLRLELLIFLFHLKIRQTMNQWTTKIKSVMFLVLIFVKIRGSIRSQTHKSESLSTTNEKVQSYNLKS